MSIKYLKLQNKEILAYIAGFLDGDGSVFCQLVKGDSYKYGYHVRVSIVFFQRADKKWFLMKLKSFIGCGYIRVRKDFMCEYVITGSEAVVFLLNSLKPFVCLKLDIINKVLEIIAMKKQIKDENDFKKLCDLVESTEILNYSKNCKNKNLYNNNNDSKISP
jgi:hypothetical protein